MPTGRTFSQIALASNPISSSDFVIGVTAADQDVRFSFAQLFSVGSNTQVIFNNAGVLSGSNNFTWSGAAVVVQPAASNNQIYIGEDTGFTSYNVISLNGVGASGGGGGLGISGGSTGDGNLYFSNRNGYVFQANNGSGSWLDINFSRTGWWCIPTGQGVTGFSFGANVSNNIGANAVTQLHWAAYQSSGSIIPNIVINAQGATQQYALGPATTTANTNPAGNTFWIGQVNNSSQPWNLTQRTDVELPFGTLRVYNTTDAGISNYERGKFGFSSNVLQIGTEQLGTGNARSMAFITGGTEGLRIDTSQQPIFTPGSTTPATLGTNGQFTMTPTSNTNFRISYRGSDGTTRVANITLA